MTAEPKGMDRIASGGRIGIFLRELLVVAEVSMARAWAERLVVVNQSSRSPMRADRSRRSPASSVPPRMSLIWAAEKMVEASSVP